MRQALLSQVYECSMIFLIYLDPTSMDCTIFPISKFLLVQALLSDDYHQSNYNYVVVDETLFLFLYAQSPHV